VLYRQAIGAGQFNALQDGHNPVKQHPLGFPLGRLGGVHRHKGFPVFAGDLDLLVVGQTEPILNRMGLIDDDLPKLRRQAVCRALSPSTRFG
jgi:hypothetical protein